MAPAAAPMIIPRHGIQKIMPIKRPQKAPPRALVPDQAHGLLCLDMFILLSYHYSCIIKRYKVLFCG